jgi:integrase
MIVDESPMIVNGAVINEAERTTPLPTEKAAHKPRRRELKNLTKREGIWYFHKRVNGKKEFNGRSTPFSLNTRDLLVAKAKREAILKAANGTEIDRVRGREHYAAASMGEIFAAYRKAPTVRAKKKTRKSNIAALTNMVLAVHGDGFDVEGMSSAELTKNLVKEWQAKRVAAAVTACAGDLSKLEAKKRALNSLLTQVQSVFSREARDDYGTFYLPPNIAEFTTALPVAARKQEEPEQLTDEFVSGLLAAADKLKPDDPGAWAAFQLMTWGGLRNTECCHARVSWLERVALGYRLKMKPTGDFLPKGNSRAVILPAEIVDAMLAQLPPIDTISPQDDRYLVPAKHLTDRHEGVYRRLNAWLRGKGVTADAGKIAYRLRKYFLNKVAEQQGVMLAQSAAGHASMQTTEGHYIGKPKMAKPIKLASS